MTDDVEWLTTAGPTELGESPYWDAQAQTLCFVDIVGGVLHRWHRGSGELASAAVGELVGSVVPRARGGVVLALRNGLATLADGLPAGAPPVVECEIEADRPATRLNDAKCDPAGRLFVGSMAGVDQPAAGSLYRVDTDWRVSQVVTGTTISNGLGWSPDGETMYFADSPTGAVFAFDYDPALGSLSNRRTFCQFGPGQGVPDGLTVDAEGGVWVCAFGGWQVHRYRPDGRLDGVVRLPVLNVTSCAFGGPGLDELYLTTAAVELSAAQRTAQPAAGYLFRCRPGVTGQLAVPFGG